VIFGEDVPVWDFSLTQEMVEPDKEIVLAHHAPLLRIFSSDTFNPRLPKLFNDYLKSKAE
jgi:hypothetical protein